MLIPLPARLRWATGSLPLAPGTSVAGPIFAAAAAGRSFPTETAQAEPARRLAASLARQLSERVGFPIPVRDGGAIRLVLAEAGTQQSAGSADAGAAAGPGRLAAHPEADLPFPKDEAYRLEVTDRGATITAAAAVGLFRGMQTLLQLLPPRRGPAPPAIPAVWIDDFPRFRWRGLHLDVARHFFAAARVKDAVDWCAWHKLNVLHWHLVDDQGWRLPVPRLPRLAEIGAWRRQAGGTRYGGAYTAAEIREVVAYAADRYVTVVPEIEMPGHARAALAAYPGLSCRGLPLPVPSSWGVFEDVLCAGKEETFGFLGVVLEEVAALFPGPFVHIGGDECPKGRWEACPDCRRRMETERLGGAGALQAWFVRRVARVLAELGRRTVGWDEILDGGGGASAADLPPETVVMSWRGFEGGTLAARTGHQVVMTPVDYCYLDHYQGPRESEPPAFPADLPLGRVYAFEPVPGDLDAGAAARILGGQGNVWTERIPDWSHLQYMVFPRLCALAEVLWSPREARERSDFLPRLRDHVARLEGEGIRHGRIGDR